MFVDALHENGYYVREEHLEVVCSQLFCSKLRVQGLVESEMFAFPTLCLVLVLQMVLFSV